MRCNNCGYDNEPGVSACIKCGHPLQGGAQGYSPYQGGGYQPAGGAEPQPRSTVVGAAYANEPQPRPTVVGAAYANEPQPRPTVVGAAYANEPQPRPTVVGAAYANEPQPRPTVVMNGGAPQQPGSAQGAAQKSCPKCGYPVLGTFTTCPGCGSPLTGGAAAAGPAKSAAAELEELDLKTTCDKCGKEVPITSTRCPYCNEPIRQKTVFVRRHNIAPPKPKCALTIIPDEGETTEAHKNSYEGDHVMLNRDNTEPENRSITSKEQAEIVCEDGKWYILNHSEMCTTAVEAGRKIEILPDDVIVLGDRRFKFTVE